MVLVGLFIGLILVSMFIISILQYFNISSNLVLFLKFSLLIISLFISSYLFGKELNKKTYKQGLYFGTIIILLSLATKILFFRDSFAYKNIIYYLIVLITSILGSIFKLQKKKGS